jgi:hypothetical protein
VPAPSDAGQGFVCADCGSGTFIIKGAWWFTKSPPVLEVARGRFELRQLRHGGHAPALARRGQALRLR